MDDKTARLAQVLRDKCNSRLVGQPSEAVGIAIMNLMVSLLLSFSDDERSALEGLDAMVCDMREGIRDHYAMGGPAVGHA